MRRIGVLAGAVALVCIAGAGVVWALRHRPLDLPVARLEQDVPVRVFGLGTMEAQVTSRIGFEVAGTLVAVLADHGDRVKVGQVLARLNPTTQQARVARSGAGLQSAEAQQL